MQLFKKVPTIKFINKRHYAFALSVLIIIAGIILYFKRGFNLGIDFTGGTMIEVSFDSVKSVSQIRSALSRFQLGDATIVQIGGENKFFIKTTNLAGMMSSETDATDTSDHEKMAKTIQDALMTEEETGSASRGQIDLNNTAEGEIASFLRTKGISEDDSQESAAIIIGLRKETTQPIGYFSQMENRGLKHRVMAVLKENSFLGHFTILSKEIVGPQVGKELQRKTALACIWALIGMLIYIAFRFKLLYGFSGILTLFHDVLVTLSFILFFNVQVDLTVIAGILTIVGYSINDTIVIFDRLRDNLKIMRKDNLETILDTTLNQTLGRTIFTSFTVFLTVMAIFLFGGEVIHPFAFTMLVGVITGSYSTIYQSCAWLKVWENSFLKRKK